MSGKKDFLVAMFSMLAMLILGGVAGYRSGKGDGYWDGDLDGYVSGAMDQRFGVREWPDGEELDRALYESVDMYSPGLPYPPFDPSEPHELRCLKR